MTEYIDIEKATTIHEPPKSQRYYQTDNLDDAYGQGWDDALNAIEKLSRANVKEIIYAHWIIHDDICTCSNCKYPTYAAWNQTKYCPNCSAEMSEVAR